MCVCVCVCINYFLLVSVILKLRRVVVDVLEGDHHGDSIRPHSVIDLNLQRSLSEVRVQVIVQGNHSDQNIPERQEWIVRIYTMSNVISLQLHVLHHSSHAHHVVACLCTYIYMLLYMYVYVIGGHQARSV